MKVNGKSSKFHHPSKGNPMQDNLCDFCGYVPEQDAIPDNICIPHQKEYYPDVDRPQKKRPPKKKPQRKAYR